MTTKGIYFNGKWYADAEAAGSSLNRTVGGNDNATGTITDTGGAISVPIPVTVATPSASTTQSTAGTRSLRAQIKILVNNIAALFGYFTSNVLKIANGGTGAATLAGQSATQRKVFASPKSTTAGAPAFAALDPADLGLLATKTELNYVDGVTSPIQTQLNGKQASITVEYLEVTGYGLTFYLTAFGKIVNVAGYGTASSTIPLNTTIATLPANWIPASASLLVAIGPTLGGMIEVMNVNGALMNGELIGAIGSGVFLSFTGTYIRV